MSSVDFYSRLPVRTGFLDIADLSNFTELPDNWSVVAADVRNSTIAIQEGHYKAVNITGASVITVVLNAVKPVQVPSIFDGDGAVVCIPDTCTSQVRKALAAASHMAWLQFGLHLRIGIVPHTEIKEAGFRVLVARHRVSAYYIQGAFSGGGVEYAEELIKNDAVESPFRIAASGQKAGGDFSGLECRWDKVPSRHGETISLIVKVRGGHETDKARIYNEIIRRVHEIYGDEEACRPVYAAGVHATLRGHNLRYEHRVRTCGAGRIDVIRYWLFMRWQVMLGWLLMRYGIRTGDIAWGDYKQDLVSNSDFRKFDGVLREVLSGTPEQRVLLTDYLTQRRQAGECFFGIHVAKSALITCLVFNRTGEHFHFIDGADGGYAMAASEMKQQIRDKSS